VGIRNRVASLYYCQPLLSDIGASLGVGPRQIGHLGDMLPRRGLILAVSLAIALAAGVHSQGFRIAPAKLLDSPHA